MIKVFYDGLRELVVIEFLGNVDAAQARQALDALERLVPDDGRRFKALADYTRVETMDVEVEAQVKKAMRLLDERGVSEVLRVLPDPDAEVGFDILSRFFYSRDVKFHTYRSRAAADGAAR